MLPDTILRLPAVKAATGLSRSTIYERIKQGTFPVPVPLGVHAVGWLASEVAAWIQGQIDKGRAASDQTSEAVGERSSAVEPTGGRALENSRAHTQARSPRSGRAFSS